MREELPKRLVWLQDPETANPDLVGGKAWGLGRIAGRYRVPDGFILPWTVFDRDGRVSRADVASAYRRLGAGGVAVRSSAIGEDGAESSFAGQHATVLNIFDVDSLLEAVRTCWASALDAGARRYREHRGLKDDAVRISVLVQQMVRADSAAVAFSRAPAGRRPDAIVINASFGLGEAIVSGRVTPDVYEVDRRQFQIVHRSIADKTVMTVIRPDGVAEVPVPGRLQRRPSLSDSQVLELARATASLEEEWGVPVDVEAGWDEEGLTLLQCRPITAL